MKKKLNVRKIFSKSVWGLSSVFFGILMAIFLVANAVAPASSNFINEFFGIDPNERVETGDEKPFDEYKSDFVNEDGSYDNQAMRKNSEKVALQTAQEGSVLLWNNDKALPLSQGSKVSFFGISSANYLYSAAGSGHLGVTPSSTLEQACKDNGLVFNQKLSNAYKFLSASYGNYLSSAGTTLDGASIGDKCYVEYGIGEAPFEKLNTTQAGNVTNTIPEYGDAAVYIISRNDGEDGDTNYNTKECIGGNYLDLAHQEVNILNQLHQYKEEGKIKKIILVINAAQPMQMKNIQTFDIDACLWAGVGGTVSNEQIATILSGRANPSGKTIDTYAYDNYSHPSTVNFGNFEWSTKTGLPSTTDYSHSEKYLTYAESIYVGYRYFETRYEDCVLNNGNANSEKGAKMAKNWDYTKEVAFPFGYGLSYTTFSHSDFKVKEESERYLVSTTITNTGSVSGKDVAQVYLQKPYTEYDKANVIEKSAVELVGFEKTKLLQPGEKQTLEVAVKKSDMKSYDAYNKGTYILEKGDYYLSEGVNAHDALNNILAKKGKTTADGMDYDGDSAKAFQITIKNDDFTKYSTSLATDYPIVNQFSDADVKLYEGVKDQFTDWKYLSRSDWDRTYPTPVIMDNLTEKLRYDMQYTHDIVEDPDAVMPKYGQAGTEKLIDFYGLDYNDPSWEKLLDQLSWEDMNNLATAGGGITGAPSVSAPSGSAKDGPGGLNVANPTVMCFPSECNMASTFNKALIEDLGNAFGMEIMHVGYHGIYGPGANIHRSPYSGRNWEYFSEDPYISSEMLANEIRGLQNRGIIVFTKHFLLNDSERNRYGVAVFSNEQSIREIYLKAFETACTEDKMNGIMSSFNRIGAIWSGKHKGLLTEVLRNEWGFKGVVQTDAYVGTHMHMAIAESVIAGNDFTMGGAVANKFDPWKNSPTLVSALRETCHRLLYTKVNSCTMNGMKVSTIIVYHTPWWQLTLIGGSIASSILFGLSMVMLLLGFLLPLLWKRHDRLALEKGNIRYFFDVISKKATVIGASLSFAAILVSIITPVAIEISKKNENHTPLAHVCEHVCPDCGLCQDYDCSYVVCEEKCECPCEHACEVCGYCIDPTSTSPRCEEKCGSDKAIDQIFEGEDSHVLLYGGATGELGIGHETDLGADEYYVGSYNGNLGARIKYVVISEVEQHASLSVSVCKRSSGILFTNSIIVTVNNQIVNSKAIVPGISEGENEWVNFVRVTLGCISLKEGRNIIEFTVASGDAANGFNFDKMFLKSNSPISWYDGEHICDHICPDCGLCQDEKCKDETCKNKCTCLVTKQEFSALDERVTLEGSAAIYKSEAVKLSSASDKAIYQIKTYASFDSYFFVDVLALDGASDINEKLALFVNGSEIELSAAIEFSAEYQRIRLPKIQLINGVNTLEVTGKDGANIALKNIVFGTEQKLAFRNPYEFSVAHDTVLITGNAYRTGDNYINMAVPNAKDSQIIFQLDSTAPTKANLILTLGCRQGVIHVADILDLNINDVKYTIDPEIQLSNDGPDLVGFSEITIGEVDLKAGLNTITLKTLIDNPEVNTTLSSIIFTGTTEKITYSDSGISMNKFIYEAEDAELVQINGNPHIVGGWGASNDAFLGGVNDVAVFNPGEAKIILTVNTTEELFVKFYVNAGTAGACSAKNAFITTVNGEAVTSDQTWASTGWYGWSNFYYSTFKLSEGENKIEMILGRECTMNIDYFLFESLGTITR